LVTSLKNHLCSEKPSVREKILRVGKRVLPEKERTMQEEEK